MGAEAEHLPALLAGLPGGAPKDIRIQPLPWSAAHEKLLTAFAGGSLPDLGQVGNSWIAELAAIGAIQPVPAAMHSLVDGQFAGVVETNRIGGRLMALPWYVDTRLQFYRKDLFERGRLCRAAAALGRLEARVAQGPARPGRGGFAILLPINEYRASDADGLSAGATFLNAARARAAHFRSPEFRDALGFLQIAVCRRARPGRGRGADQQCLERVRARAISRSIRRDRGRSAI